MTCPLHVNDGAYILGALAPAERAEFEEHLASCPPCRDSVAALAGLPGLLGRLDPKTVLPSVTAPPQLLTQVLARARAGRAAQRRRRLLTTAAACVAVAAIAATVGAGIRLANAPSGPAATMTTEQLRLFAMTTSSQYSPVEAEVGIRPGESGTLVEVRCLYQSQRDGEWPIWLVVYPRAEDEEAEALGSWVARPGSRVQVSGVTHYAPAQIARIELQGTGNQTIAWWSP